MIDSEIQRLRRLRAAALRVRAVARELMVVDWTRDDPLLAQARCTAWRIARAASGRLRAHPYTRFQKDAGLGVLLSNWVAAKLAAAGASSRTQALEAFKARLRLLGRELDDARALTRVSDLSDAFGRSQQEIRWLVGAIGQQVLDVEPLGARPPLDPPRRLAPVPDAMAEHSIPAGDWPYLAF